MWDLILAPTYLQFYKSSTSSISQIKLVTEVDEVLKVNNFLNEYITYSLKLVDKHQKEGFQSPEPVYNYVIIADN